MTGVSTPNYHNISSRHEMKVAGFGFLAFDLAFIILRHPVTDDQMCLDREHCFSTMSHLFPEHLFMI